MISIAHRYTDFGPILSDAFVTPPEDGTALESARLLSFDKGYQAGWDDAVEASKNEQRHISSEFAQSLQDMSFSYFEASGKLTAAIRPLLDQMATVMLPQMVQKALPLHVLEQISDMVDPQLENRIRITVAPANLPALEKIMSEQSNHPFSLEPDPGLSENQAFLCVDKSERELDFSETLNAITDTLDAFFQHSEDGQKNG